MQKKLIAVAVAGALGVPAVAFAQASTVNIYGQITYEYGIARQGTAPNGVGRPSMDHSANPGGSALGFRGEEKLGGGLSAWFQCETSIDVRAFDLSGWCGRNSAVGFKGGFGNVHFGRWDTPMKRALNVGTVGAEETGILGMSFIAFGGSGAADIAGAGNDDPVAINRQRWKRREAALSYYESPRMGGFQLLGAFSTGIGATNSSAVNTDFNKKPRVISLAGIYSAGPLGVGLAYEWHNEVGTLAGPELDDKAWGISAAYTFAKTVKIGFTHLDAKYETGLTTQLKKRTNTLGVDWRVSGPHTIEAQYVWVGDSRGNSTTGIGGRGGHAATGPDTGGDGFSVSYKYDFSKRTSIKFAYVLVDNEARTATYRIGETASIRAGEKQSAYGFHIRHRF